MRLPPAALNVTKLANARAPEVEALHSIIKNNNKNKKSIRKRKGQDEDEDLELQGFAVRRNERRRTTSYVNRKANLWKKRKRDASKRSTRFKIKEGEDEEKEAKEGKKMSRRVRRRIELKGGDDGGFGCSRDGTIRLTTHVWHAKRFTMTKEWGYYLPLGLHGKGRGSRAVLKWSKSGTLLHDASYYSVVQLEGPEDSLLNVLRKVLEPSPPLIEDMSETSRAELYGLCYGTAMLQKVEESCYGSIAPITYLWCPLSPYTPKSAVDKDMKDNHASTDKERENKNQTRQLWIWIHAAAFDDAFDTLLSASQTQSEEDGSQLVCFSRQRDLGRIDVLGSRALQLLQKTLHPISRLQSNAEGFEFENPVDSPELSASNISQLSEAYLLANADKLPVSAVLPMEVYDPRDTPAIQDKFCPKVISVGSDDQTQQTHCVVSHTVESEVANKLSDLEILGESGNEEVACISGNRFSFVASKDKESEKPLNTFTTYDRNKALWCSQSEGLSVDPPLSESLLSKKRHLQRLAFFYLDEGDVENDIVENDQGGFSKSCPIMLLKIDSKKPSACGWSIILPVSWVRAFWLPLVLGGARAIGLRERRWLSSSAGIPLFPYDFPDCKAYWDFMNKEAAVYEKMISLRPSSKRPPPILLPSPWNCIQSSVQRGCNGRGDLSAHISEAEDEYSGPMNAHGFSLVYSVQNKLGTPDVTSKEQLDSYDFSSIQKTNSCFPGFIVRTSTILKQYLRRIGGLNLFIFPETHNCEKKNYFCLTDEGRVHWKLKGVSNITFEREPCFLRVLLYAPGKGVFEDGAIVSAPTGSDFAQWSSRSERWQGLEIHPSLRNVDCNQQWMSNNKIIQPADMSSRCGQQNLRRPIGFVTTGACRGSVPALAVAMCEGSILEQLRAEQGRETKWRKKSEIFVLVRNMKSNVYRPALASIVLEEIEDITYW